MFIYGHPTAPKKYMGIGSRRTFYDFPANEASSCFGSGSSKFFFMRILPCMAPGLRAAPLARLVPYRATSWFDLAMMISSPLAASSTNRENWVFAC